MSLKKAHKKENDIFYSTKNGGAGIATMHEEHADLVLHRFERTPPQHQHQHQKWAISGRGLLGPIPSLKRLKIKIESYRQKRGVGRLQSSREKAL